MLHIPTDDEIRGRAIELGLAVPSSDPLDPTVRRRVAKLLSEEHAETAQPAAPTLLSQVSHPADGGMVRVTVEFIPNRKDA